MKRGIDCNCHCHLPGVTSKHMVACCDGIIPTCRNSPKYFPQLVCELKPGHKGDHDDKCGYRWEN